jgi:hypothetical protein
MIKANELRIGNIVNISPKDSPDWLIESCVRTESLIAFLKGYTVITPIQITEDWLLKFGLIPDERSGLFSASERIRELSSKDIGIKYCSFFFNSRLGRWMDCQTRVCVDSVHQLQNLYFALTGEELTVKEEVA